jgi:hypothetical protein
MAGNRDATARVMEYASAHEGEMLTSVVVAKILDIPRGTVGSVFSRLSYRPEIPISKLASGCYVYGKLGQRSNGETPALKVETVPLPGTVSDPVTEAVGDVLYLTVEGKTPSGKLRGTDELGRAWVQIG